MELLERFLVVGVLIRMVLERESSVRLLDLGWCGTSLQFEYLVEVSAFIAKCKVSQAAHGHSQAQEQIDCVSKHFC